MHFHFNNKKPLLPATPAVWMLAPAPEEESGEGEATPFQVKRATVVSHMRLHRMIQPSLKVTERLLSEWHRPLRDLQVNVSDAIRSDIDSAMRNTNNPKFLNTSQGPAKTSNGRKALE